MGIILPPSFVSDGTGPLDVDAAHIFFFSELNNFTSNVTSENAGAVRALFSPSDDLCPKAFLSALNSLLRSEMNEEVIKKSRWSSPQPLDSNSHIIVEDIIKYDQQQI